MKKILKFCFNTSIWTPTRLEWISLLSALPVEERDRIARYNFKSDSKQTLIGQILIRYSLKNLLNIEWNHLQLARNSKGRPYLKIKDTLSSAKLGLNSFEHLIDFNVSHSGDFTIVAAGTCSINSSKKEKEKHDIESDDSFKIGTDVMKIDIDRIKTSNPNDDDATLFEKELARHERVINSKFSTIEKNYIYNRPNPVEKLTAFYRLWCMKESYVKALGEGIGFDLKRVECMANSELFIDLNSKKYLVVNDSQLFIDSKLIKNCKFYEQYYMNNLVNSDSNKKFHLHIMTVCIIEKEKSKESKSSSSSSSSNSSSSNASNDTKNEMNEFVEVELKDLLATLIPLENVEDDNSEKFEDYWLRFNQKAESPFPI